MTLEEIEAELREMRETYKITKRQFEQANAQMDEALQSFHRYSRMAMRLHWCEAGFFALLAVSAMIWLVRSIF